MTDPRVSLIYDRISENVGELIGDVVEFGGGYAIDNGVERYAWAFRHVEMLDVVHPFPGANDGAQCGTRRLESSLEFRGGRTRFRRGGYRGDDASELRLGRMSSVLVGGCISIVSGRDSKTLGTNEVKISHRPRFDLDYNLVTRSSGSRSNATGAGKKAAFHTHRTFFLGYHLPN